MGEFRDFLIEGKWTYFPRDNKFVRGQRTFSFEKEDGPQITHDAHPYIDRSMVDYENGDDDTNYRIYHVTYRRASRHEALVVRLRSLPASSCPLRAAASWLNDFNLLT